MKLGILKTFGLMAVVAVSLTTAAKADIITDYYWVQGPSSGTAAASFFDGAFLNPTITSSGNLTYDLTTKTISGYTFDVIGAITIADTSVSPTSPDSIILPGGNLHLSPVDPGTGNVTSLGSKGQWIDDLVFDSADQNYFQTSAGSAITGDWVPVPEPTTVIAGILMLLPFGVSAVKIIRNRKANLV
jgi:hypothetical protein